MTHGSKRIVAFAVGVVVLMLLVGIASNAEQFTAPGVRAPGQRDVLPIEQDLGEGNQRDSSTPREPVELPESLAVGVAIVAGLGLIYLLSRQRLRLRRPSFRFARSTQVEVTEEEQADAIAEAATDLIDELNATDSPRLAIQRAYAAVETGFGAKELARRPAETPLRYLERIFGRHVSVKEPLARLTDLFQEARFSNAPVDEPMRADAITALTEIRDYYKNFAWNKISKRRSKAST